MPNLTDLLKASLKINPEPSLGNVVRSGEMRRIEALPRRVFDLKRVPDLTLRYRRDGLCNSCSICQDGKAYLRPIQSAMLLAAEEEDGLFAAVGVGHGKELATLLLPQAMRAKRPVILTEARLRNQLVEI